MASYKDLEVWKEAIALVKEIYIHTKSFPKEEQYGLVSQMRRSAVSIPSNIAEGRSRGSRNELRQFLRIAFGSGAELETQLLISKDLEYLEEGKYLEMMERLDRIQRMLNRFIHVVSDNPKPNT
ncbi:MAG: four helix bundle protein [Candidatus Uhrbacteria bacterium]|nr:four helix bundle protein [Candidatus Uhrbacteria bacterium]